MCDIPFYLDYCWATFSHTQKELMHELKMATETRECVPIEIWRRVRLSDEEIKGMNIVLNDRGWNVRGPFVRGDGRKFSYVFEGLSG